ncbi:DUF397 domain-containing protein [Streptomyces sp. NPDC003077]|uniref:DUF397 domain-containing protein n=1 Tax=Streptomyces sp. NPDC003077 TaxID=3154443 RepID=UPI0033BA243F
MSTAPDVTDELMTEPIGWRKSSFSGGGDGNECVEATGLPGGAALRESDAPEAVVRTSRAAFRALLRVLKADRLT